MFFWAVLTFVGYQMAQLFFETRPDGARLEYETAGRLERTSQNQLSAAIEKTKQQKYIVCGKVIGSITMAAKLPALIHWLRHFTGH